MKINCSDYLDTNIIEYLNLLITSAEEEHTKALKKGRKFNTLLHTFYNIYHYSKEIEVYKRQGHDKKTVREIILMNESGGVCQFGYGVNIVEQ